jgi:hypothetical protein
MARNQRDLAEKPRPHEPSLVLFPNLTSPYVDKLHATQTAHAQGGVSASQRYIRYATEWEGGQQPRGAVQAQTLLCLFCKNGDGLEQRCCTPQDIFR